MDDPNKNHQTNLSRHITVLIILTRKAQDLLNIRRTRWHCSLLRGEMQFFYYTTIKQTFVDIKKVPKGIRYYRNEQYIKISAQFVDNQ